MLSRSVWNIKAAAWGGSTRQLVALLLLITAASAAEEQQPPQRADLTVQGCDVYRGQWIRVNDPRQAYPYDNSCPFIDSRQTCVGKEQSFLDWEWRPSQCTLPFFDAHRFLELLRNRVMAFVGDSLGRNQFESLSCLLAAADEFEQIGGNSDLSITRRYTQYNATIHLILSPYLVEHTPKTYSKHMGAKTVHLDIPDADWHFRHREFDVVYFATAGRWFLGSAKFAMKYTDTRHRQPTSNKVEVHFSPPTATPWDAIHRAFTTVLKSLTRNGIFLWKSYSPSHFADGTWDAGGHCHTNVFPSEVTTIGLDRDPNIRPLEGLMRRVLRPQYGAVMFNVTHMAEQRSDAHPADLNNIAKKGSVPAQDCVHWCLPGIPDVWNRFLLVHLERRLGGAPPGPGVPDGLPFY